jgi:DHA2 family multidrug resistance protein
MALQPPYLQELMDYPVVTAGLVMGPRGIGTMASMLIVGRLVGRTDTRILLFIGLCLTAWSFNAMTGWTPDVSQEAIIGVTMVQGFGLGFLFVPLSAATLSTLPLAERAEGAGLFSLSRNIGSSVGISIVNTLLVQNTQANHAAIVPSVTAVNRGFENPLVANAWNPLTAAGRAALDAVITRQAQIIAYIDDYKLLMIAALAVIPLLIVFKKWTDRQATLPAPLVSTKRRPDRPPFVFSQRFAGYATIIPRHRPPLRAAPRLRLFAWLPSPRRFPDRRPSSTGAPCRARRSRGA